MAKAVVPLEWPRATVFAILADFLNYPKWVPGVEGLTIQSSADASSEGTMTLGGMMPMLACMKFETQQDAFVSFQMTSSKDLKIYTCVHRLMDAEDGKGSVLVSEMELEAFKVPGF